MTDAGPRIFRTLEKIESRDSFDAIVRAAVAGFAAAKRPSERQALEFGRLVLPLFDGTGTETRQMLAASLATTPVLPRDLVERILAEPTGVAAPFLAASPLLTPADLAVLARRRDAATRKLLKARAEPKAPPSTKPKRAKAALPSGPADEPTAPVAERRKRFSPARQTALLSTGSPDPSAAHPPAAEPPAPARPEPTTAEETRTALRQLATTGRRQPLPVAAPRPEPAPDLLSLALACDIEGFQALLSAKLLLDAGKLAAIEADRTGRELAAALKALDVAKADAMTMVMMLKTAIGSDVAAFETLERIYETLDVLACRMRFPIGPGAFAESATHRPVFASTQAPARSEGRTAVFGRRSAIPAQDARKRRS